jgi:hypothetical protein
MDFRELLEKRCETVQNIYYYDLWKPLEGE